MAVAVASAWAFHADVWLPWVVPLLLQWPAALALVDQMVAETAAPSVTCSVG